jgi:hypothetical protein
MRIRDWGLALFLTIALTASSEAIPGDTLWTRFYGSPDGEVAYAVKEIPTGGYYITGCTNAFGNGFIDFYLVKISADGDVIWDNHYGGYDDDYALSATLTEDGGIVMAGWTKSFGAGGTDIYVVRTDPDGNIVFQQTYGGSRDDTAKCVIEANDGSFVICGSTQSFDRGYTSDAYVIRIGPSGNLIWSHRSGGVLNDGATCIVQTAEKEFAFTGWTGDSDNNHDIYVEKINGRGETIWSQGYSPGIDNQGVSIIESADQNLIITGYTFLNPVYLEVYLMKLSNAGSLIWDRHYGSNVWEVGSCIRETPDNGYILAGSRWRALFPDTTQFYLVKTDSLGAMQWSHTYGYGQLDEGFQVEITSDGNYIMAGYSNATWPSTVDMCVIKVEGEWSTGIEDGGIEIPQAFAINNAYPNPFNAVAEISYQLPIESDVKLVIYDILGNEIAILAQGRQTAGQHQANWDASGVSSGLYFVRLNSADNMAVRKITLLK